MNNVWIIGDSFVDEFGIDSEKKWSAILKENFKGDDIFILGRGGLDANTILDTLLINLSRIKENDLVIVYLPTIWRHRLPLQKIHWGKYEDMIGEVTRNKKSHKILNSFMHSNLLLDYREYLEPPFCMDSVIIRDKIHPENEYTSLINPLDFYRMASCSDSQVNRIEKILQSVKETKHNTIFEFFTWSDEWDTKLIQNTNKIGSLVGVYETLHHRWTLSGGTEGAEGDNHFSATMNKRFANYIMDKYPKHFTNSLQKNKLL